MNKQELIEKYKTKYAEEPKDWRLTSVNTSRQALFANFINDLGQLDEPKKVVVPKFVAEWLEECKNNASLGECLKCFHFGSGILSIVSADENVEGWINEGDNDLLLARAWLDGYEVEKEQLYYVNFGFDRFLIKGKCKTTMGDDFIWIEEWECIENEGFEDLVKFTEQEIKSIDERYWLFAVKVDGE
ncbi:DUF1642 domain-containing protein [Enterococcus faecalis]|uniref:DUF1642 domain-containing protein n=1 Tax=Enterococcus faecalis TaxID=1351 RepID=UPI000F5001ED|nr:DUF1642 domain-containing protein [Enterococcus faecalis]EKS9941575.1 DUF1642 domain-containing protein [Enterococcus faecalis]ROW81522.1 DUF1642 domain-containing protein [Enterococcus faecalis]ROW85346.1 DUF1642 domain-containing protein [Enterococcus faecalis]ROX22981.1 DUF1642 domain-containing protein [Enterococcus faecalis]ROY13947.1 DUF1642 domain-containing protein [Enterococcus faecalis]